MAGYALVRLLLFLETLHKTYLQRSPPSERGGVGNGVAAPAASPLAPSPLAERGATQARGS
jgi:hypothetical protein